MFSSLIGFTEMCARYSPATLAVCVNSVFDVFDSIVDCHNVFKARYDFVILQEAQLSLTNHPTLAHADVKISLTENATKQSFPCCAVERTLWLTSVIYWSNFPTFTYPLPFDALNEGIP